MTNSVVKKSWEEFRQAGLLVFVNQFLHIFGWSIIFEMDEDGFVKNVYPARVTYAGFSHDVQADAYKKIRDYMNKNYEQLLKEINE